MYKLCVMSDDDFYNDQLERYVRMKQHNQFTVLFYSKLDTCLSKINEEKCDVLLIESKYFNNELQEKIGRTALVILADSANEVARIDLPAVYKHETGEQMVSTIARVCYEQLPENEQVKLKSTQMAKMIGVYSPQGGTGKTSIAMMLARHFAQRDVKTLLISLERIPSLNYFLPSEADKDFSDLLFSFTSHGNNRLNKLKETFINDRFNFKYIAPCKCVLDIDPIDRELFSELLMFFEQNNLFDIVVVDFDSGFDQQNRNILKLCNWIITPFTPDEVGNEKICTFKQSLKYMGEEDIINKQLFVTNSPMQINTNQASFSNIEIICDIPFDGLYKSNPTQAGIYSAFGNALSDLAVQIMDNNSRGYIL